jgi:outer membrane protein assembly factor BamB
VDRNLVYAGWSYGGEKDFRSMMPSFDDLLEKAGEKGLGYLTRKGAEKLEWTDSFDELDTDKDGKISRKEWDAYVDFKASGKNVALSLKPGVKGKVTDKEVNWRGNKEGLPYIASPLVYQGLMYTVTEEGLLSAHDVKTGKPVFVKKRVGLAGKAYASPVAANGHIYLCSTDGAVVVRRAGKAVERVSAERLDGRIAASPAVAGNTMYIRTDKSLYAFAEKE